jgi:hypothetical protein
MVRYEKTPTATRGGRRRRRRARGATVHAPSLGPRSVHPTDATPPSPTRCDTDTRQWRVDRLGRTRHAALAVAAARPGLPYTQPYCCMRSLSVSQSRHNHNHLYVLPTAISRHNHLHVLPTAISRQDPAAVPSAPFTVQYSVLLLPTRPSLSVQHRACCAPHSVQRPDSTITADSRASEMEHVTVLARNAYTRMVRRVASCPS